MSADDWSAVDLYINDLFGLTDDEVAGALKASAKAGLPAISVAPSQGKFLMLLAKMCKAHRILEVGTLGGYSTIWLARALAAGGSLVTLEADPKHAEVARKNIANAGLSDAVQVVVGDATKTMQTLVAEGLGPFDFIFIDADKPGYPIYLEHALQLSRSGTVIVADNVVRKGEVANPGSTDERVIGVRRFNQLFAEDSRISGTILQMVGSKGYDGMAIGIVL